MIPLGGIIRNFQPSISAFKSDGRTVQSMAQVLVLHGLRDRHVHIRTVMDSWAIWAHHQRVALLVDCSEHLCAFPF